ncbi:MAG: hypothetical protein IT377_05190 [Polyangiaceae bacterium]|nr:hypothetical protein [Polyangiaceae bacterium]
MSRTLFLASVPFGFFALACGSSDSSGGPIDGGAGSGGSATGGSTSGGAGGSAGSGTGGSAGSASGGSAGSGTGGAGTGGSATGGAGGASCTPTGGSGTVKVSCDDVSLAVLEMAGKPASLRVAGRLVAANGTCLLPESVELVRPDKSTAHKLTAIGKALKAWDSVAWASGDATSEISGRCKDELDRIEPYGIIVKGKADGGTFEAKCGTGVEGGSSWPPRVMLTCHSGLTDPPAFGNAMVQPMGPIVSTQLMGQLPHPAGPGVTSVASDIRIVPFQSSFGGGAPVPPFSTSGWKTSVSETTIPATGQISTSLNAFSDKDVLGAACPLPSPMDAMPPTPPPIFFARLSGQGPSGAFTGELVVRMCTRTK